MFSARTTMAEHLQVIRDQAALFTDGRTDLATAKLRLKESLQGLGYAPSDEDRGGLKDLSSERRRELVVRMNTEFAQGAGRHQADQDPDRLDAWPAQELVRDRASRVPRDWQDRWLDAGGKLYPGGRMIALKNDPIWRRLSRFGKPYPPFDYNSGMGLEDISRAEAIELGVMGEDDEVQPEPLDLSAGLERKPAISEPGLRRAVLRSLGDGYEFNGEGVLRLRPTG